MDCFPAPVSGFGEPKLFGATGHRLGARRRGGERVRGLTGGRGALCVVECVGTRSSLDTALAVVRDGGSIAMVGGPHGPVDDISPSSAATSP
ncbi:zinc-binding dehydrogenase [Saccharopolyspora hattusasensis]|uniref:zinc-binding dehydrogenase n=1 Tax=Saccharopolyspora hattusasensis TaxID=1128679 RepID=UPI003D967B05